MALAKSGKHILSEKPCATDAAELSITIDQCKKHGVQFMDGVMFRHSLRTDRIREYIRDPQHFGQLTRIASHFSFYGDDDFRSNDIRTKSNLERFGCLGDLGWYNILFTLCMVNFELPQRVSGNILSHHRDPSCDAAVPMSFSAELSFKDGVTASFYCSFESDLQQWASVGSTHGHVWLNDFVIPFSGRKPRFNAFHTTTEGEHCVMAMHEGKTEIEVNETSHGEVDSQETKLFRKFAAIVNSGQLDWSWAEASLKTQTVMDACFQAGLSGETIELA
jgi:predicted dehydrogenase